MNNKVRFNQRGLRNLAWLITLVSLVLIAAGGYLFYWNRAIALVGQVGFPEDFFGVILGLGYGIVGLLILSYRPGHGIGWLFLGVAFLSALDFFAKQYALYGLVLATLPGAIWMAWLQSWLSYLIFPAPIILLFLLFPDGKLPSPRWGLLVWLGVLSTVCLAIGELVRPGLLGVHIADSWISLGVFNPTGMLGWTEFSDALNNAWFREIMLHSPQSQGWTFEVFVKYGILSQVMDGTRIVPHDLITSWGKHGVDGNRQEIPRIMASTSCRRQDGDIAAHKVWSASS